MQVLFLLNIACTEVSFNNGIELFSPKGSGWKAIISFIYAKLPDFFQNNLKSVLPILSKWCNFNKTGIITKYAGLLVLNLIKQIEESDYPIYCVEKIKKKLFPVVFNSAEELKTELSSIFNNVIANKWVETNAPYYDFCSEILLKPYKTISELSFFLLGLYNFSPRRLTRTSFILAAIISGSFQVESVLNMSVPRIR